MKHRDGTEGDENNRPFAPETHDERAIRLARWQIISAICALAVLVGGAGATLSLQFQGRAYDVCQRQYNQDVVEALAAGREAAELDRRALRLTASSGVNMIEKLLATGVTQQQSIEAIQKWRTDLKEADGMLGEAEDKRKAKPLPPPRQC